jgi:hypothetical protein
VVWQWENFDLRVKQNKYGLTQLNPIFLENYLEQPRNWLAENVNQTIWLWVQMEFEKESYFIENIYRKYNAEGKVQ